MIAAVGPALTTRSAAADPAIKPAARVYGAGGGDADSVDADLVAGFGLATVRTRTAMVGIGLQVEAVRDAAAIVTSRTAHLTCGRSRASR